MEARGSNLSSEDHSEAISDHFGFFGLGPCSEYLTYFEILEIQFFSNSSRDYSHWNRIAILDPFPTKLGFGGLGPLSE